MGRSRPDPASYPGQAGPYRAGAEIVISCSKGRLSLGRVSRGALHRRERLRSQTPGRPPVGGPPGLGRYPPCSTGSPRPAIQSRRRQAQDQNWITGCEPPAQARSKGAGTRKPQTRRRHGQCHAGADRGVPICASWLGRTLGVRRRDRNRPGRIGACPPLPTARWDPRRPCPGAPTLGTVGSSLLTRAARSRRHGAAGLTRRRSARDGSWPLPTTSGISQWSADSSPTGLEVTTCRRHYG